MKKTLLYTALGCSIIANAGLFYLMNDATQIASDYIDETIELRSEIKALESENTSQAREILELRKTLNNQPK